MTGFKVGDAAFASRFDLGAGSLAEFAAVPEHAALKPANLDFLQAVSIPMVGLTSWQALAERAAVKTRHKVSIPAGSGGIGTFAIQLARHLGAIVGTTTSTAKVAMVRELGADDMVDYKEQAFEQVLHGCDAVLGTIKGDGLEKPLRIVKPGSAAVSLIGPPDAAFAREGGMNVVMRFLFSLLSHKIIGLAKRREGQGGRSAGRRVEVARRAPRRGGGTRIQFINLCPISDPTSGNGCGVRDSPNGKATHQPAPDQPSPDMALPILQPHQYLRQQALGLRQLAKPSLNLLQPRKFSCK